MPNIFITGTAGFVGFHLARRLLSMGWTVTGLDAVTDYYDLSLKRARLAELATFPAFKAIEGQLEQAGLVAEVCRDDQFDAVVHLAAQAGVRYSIDAPETYVQSNLIGTFNVLEAVRHAPVKHFMMASTSSIYGANEEMPYRETDRTATQVSFYAATKAANEAMAHSYAHLYGQPTTMFRFFTVYGPWGRPDMAYFKFARAILAGEAIDVYNQGRMRRDFTYIDDLVEALVRLLDVAPEQGQPVEGDSLSPVAPFRVVNIGNASPVELGDFIAALEGALGLEAKKNLLPMQAGDVTATWADTSLLANLTGYVPSTPVDEGLKKFVAWYRGYYQD